MLEGELFQTILGGLKKKENHGILNSKTFTLRPVTGCAGRIF